MHQLRVSLNYGASAYTPPGARSDSPLALPVRVLDDEGGLIAEGGASGAQPAEFDIPPDFETVFVRLTWPSGKTETRRVSYQTQGSADVTFTDQAIARNEWSAWAVPRVSQGSPLARTGPPVDAPSVGAPIEKFDRVWLRLWQFVNGDWGHSNLTPRDQFRSDTARQLDFDLDARPWLLQVGGATVPWQFVSLPGGGPCRVLLTPTDPNDRRTDPLTIVVTGFRSDAETLMEFLSRDAMRAAASLASFRPLAERLLAEKSDDPIAAVAGAYFLLRTQGWRGIPPQWFDNLNSMFPWIPDAAIIRCIVLIRGGLRPEDGGRHARDMLSACLERGLPIYAEGLPLLTEAASVLRSATTGRRPDKLFDAIERLAAASAWAGSALSFYGRTPDEPSPEKLVGTPARSRVMGGGAASKSGGRAASRDRGEAQGAQERDADARERSPRFGASGRPAGPIRSGAAGPEADMTGVHFLGDIGR
jgi:hypothetical protein